MYGESRLSDLSRALHAIASNQVARFAPRYYVTLTAQTGRGAKDDSDPSAVAAYFWDCFLEYFEVLGAGGGGISSALADRVVLEYGPGDIPGVALLMYAHGARRVYCADRFPLLSMSRFNVEVVEVLLSRLDGATRARAAGAFSRPGDLASGLDNAAITYLVRKDGLSGLSEEVDLVVSRAVLEHVSDLEGTFLDMSGALRPGGVGVHQVDLRSHGLHRRSPLDFLTWPERLWSMMYGHKGFPNRWRVNRYREAIARAGLDTLRMSVTATAGVHDIQEVRPRLAAPFRNLSDDDLACLGFWLVVRKPCAACDASAMAPLAVTAP